MSGHGHQHEHFHGPATSSVLRLGLLLTAVYIVLLVVFGFRAHSLALLSEAGHNTSDFLALLLSWFAVYLEERPATDTKTYGYQRAGVLAAFANSSVLLFIAAFIVYQAVQRFYHPQPVQAATMMWVALAGVLLNGVLALALLRGRRDLNIRSALLHEVGDTLSTAAVILGGWAILLTGRTWIDSALSIVIAVLIVWSSLGIIRESLNILLEGTPRGVVLEEIRRALLEVDGVKEVHDLHVWSLGSHSHALSCHINIADIPASASDAMLAAVRALLAARFEISHTTIQFESAACEMADGCVLPAHDAPHNHPH